MDLQGNRLASNHSLTSLFPSGTKDWKMDLHSGKFLVVEFPDGLQLIPRNWVHTDGRKAYWPNFTSTTAYYRAVQSMESPNPEWTLHTFLRIMGSSDDFLRAREKLKAAEDKTDLGTEEETPIRKRKRIPKRQWSSESEDEITSLAPFPRCPTVQLDHATPAASSASRTSIENSGEEMMKKILKVLVEVRGKINDLSERQRIMSEQLDKLSRKELTEDVECCDGIALPVLPIPTLEALQQVEKDLEVAAFHKKMVSSLRKIGGSNVKEIIVRVMTSLLRNEVAQEFSWLGAKRKRVFSSLKLRRVIDDIVLNQDATATKSSVEVIVKGWLKHAKARHEREVTPKNSRTLLSTLNSNSGPRPSDSESEN
ncbi:uncharacterized protein LOC124172778 isoform X5 [Ischnura elegans]|uniref:uncharacterized protein LOC124172778 isoform X5 n=1 Tax=Ischnura elegans TaxID=197161 RepID=UPI001ED8A712|nr:uncharacterized protein LOC124172778 isoform X5 [Ischnura elegans]